MKLENIILNLASVGIAGTVIGAATVGYTDSAEKALHLRELLLYAPPIYTAGAWSLLLWSSEKAREHSTILAKTLCGIFAASYVAGYTVGHYSDRLFQNF